MFHSKRTLLWRKWITIYSTKTLFFPVQLWEMCTQSNLHFLVLYERLPHFFWDYECSLPNSQWIQIYEAKVCWYPMKLRNVAKGLCISNCFCTIKLLSDFQTGNNMSLSYMETSSNLLQLKITCYFLIYFCVLTLFSETFKDCLPMTFFFFLSSPVCLCLPWNTISQVKNEALRARWFKRFNEI